MLSDTEALALLTSIPHLGPVKIRLLIERFGSPCEALKASHSALTELPGFGTKILQAWETTRIQGEWRRDFDLAFKNKIKIIAYTNPIYPRRLLDLIDHPVILYIKGDLKPQDHHGIAVVGTRRASLYGREMAARFTTDLARYGYTIVSGLARGIDTTAHERALQFGRTVAVIGSGLANIYPRENERLAEHIASQGALISEFSMTTPPDRQNFPQRNRIVSGMTQATLLIEAPLDSGAMITANKALNQKRALFALPGRADNETFRGNHLLLKQGQAQLVEEAKDIADSLGCLFPGSAIKTIPQIPQVPLEPEEKLFLDKLPNDELSLEEMGQCSCLPASKVSILVMSLVLKKFIKEFPGKIYKKVELH